MGMQPRTSQLALLYLSILVRRETVTAQIFQSYAITALTVAAKVGLLLLVR